jgi:hypothetical protein
MMRQAIPEVATVRRRAAWLEQVVVDMCRLAAIADGDAVRSVTVVGGRRLTGAEMIRVREEATERGVRLTMDGDGDVTLRPVR